MSRQVWRERWPLWAIPAALLVVNLLFAIGYRAKFADRVGALRTEVEREQAELDRLVDQRQQLEDLLQRVQTSSDGIEELYEERFSSESERFIELLREVKDLAERAGLTPTRFNYPERELEDSGLIERSIVFNVSGNYAALRRFINFLELSDQYVVLRSVRLEGGEGQLNLSVVLSTLFTEGPRLDTPRSEA